MAQFVSSDGRSTEFDLNLPGLIKIFDGETPICCEDVPFPEIFADGGEVVAERLADGRLLISSSLPSGPQLLLTAEESALFVTEKELNDDPLEREKQAVESIRAMSLESLVGKPGLFKSLRAIRFARRSGAIGIDLLILLLFALKVRPYAAWTRTGDSAVAFIGRLDSMRRKGLLPSECGNAHLVR